LYEAVPFEDLYARRDATSSHEVDVFTGRGEASRLFDRIVYRLGFISGVVPGLPEQVRVGNVDVHFTLGPILTQRTHVRQRFGTDLAFDKSMRTDLEVGRNQPITVGQIESPPLASAADAMPVWRDQVLAAIGLVASVLDERIAIEELFEDLVYLSGNDVVGTGDMRARVRHRLPFSVTDVERKALDEIGTIDLPAAGSELSSAARWYLRGTQSGPTADGVLFLWIAIEALTPARSTDPKTVEAMLTAAGWDVSVHEVSVGRLAGLRAQIVHGGIEAPALLQEGYYHLEAIARVLIRYASGLDSTWPAPLMADVFDEPFRTELAAGVERPTTDWHTEIPSPTIPEVSERPTWGRVQPTHSDPPGNCAVEVFGALQPGWDRRLRFWTASAVRDVEPRLESVRVEVGEAEGFSAGVEAAAGGERILVSPELLRAPNPRKEIRLARIIYGLVAQHIAMQRGLTSEGLGILLLELAGEFVAFDEFVTRGPLEEKDLTLRRANGLDLLTLGGHIGASLAGSTRARVELDRWRADADPDAAQLIEHLEDAFAGSKSFADVLGVIREILLQMEEEGQASE
jgi:hypothetical protein